MIKIFDKKENLGITLIALIVTIIILLILAGISIVQLTGNGLFEKAKTAKEVSKNAQEDENDKIAKYSNEINSYVDGNRGTVTLTDEEYAQFKSLIQDKNKNCNYSTEEQVVGTWIDGKPLYQKTITTNMANTVSTWQKKYELGNTCIIRNTTTPYIVDSKYDIPLNYLGDTLLFLINTNAAQSRENGSISFYTSSSEYLNKTIVLTVQYTKTTDTAN